MELLVIVGAAALIGAYASSRNSRDRELARQTKKALGDAKRANKRGDPQAAAYYMQVARDLSVQRLLEAEQRALNEAHQLQADGHPKRAEKRLAKAREIRATLVRDFHQQPNQPGPSMPVATPPPVVQPNGNAPVAYPAIPPYAEYSSRFQFHSSASPSSVTHAGSSSASVSRSSPSYLPPAPRYEASVSGTAPPPGAVRYYNQPPLPPTSSSTSTSASSQQQQQRPAYQQVTAVPYPAHMPHNGAVPSIAPPPYVPSISSSPSTSQPWEMPSKVH